MKFAIAVALQRSGRADGNVISETDTRDALLVRVAKQIQFETQRDIRPTIVDQRVGGSHVTILGGDERKAIVDCESHLYGHEVDGSATDGCGNIVIRIDRAGFRKCSRIFKEQRICHRADHAIETMIAGAEQVESTGVNRL